MINKILQMIKGISLGQDTGRFLSDKSYGYDVIFFMSKYIINNLSSDNNRFDKSIEKEFYIEYTKDTFRLNQDSSGVSNYMNESLNLLEFTGVISKDVNNNQLYSVHHLDVLIFLSEKMENSYIFLYLISYQVLINHNIMGLYTKFLENEEIYIKEHYLSLIHDIFIEESISIGSKTEGTTNWSQQMVKYPMIVLNYINNNNYVTRTLKVSKRKVSSKDIALNVSGTRTPSNVKKINDYIDNLDLNYIYKRIYKYILTEDIKENIPDLSDYINVATELAELKIDILKTNRDVSPEYREMYVKTKIKTRNSSIQNIFRNNLITNSDAKCAFCDISITQMLIASHIIPYSECDNTNDAINSNNGLLLCPNHDFLFESGNNLTVNADTGEIIISYKYRKYGFFNDLEGVIIDEKLLNNERRNYLRYHNEMFKSKNKNNH